MPAKLVIGRTEKIRLLPEDIVLEARVDTGASTSSISAIDIEHFKREGKKWVRFRVVDEKAGVDLLLERPYVRRVRIKNRAAEARGGASIDRRSVVRMRVCMDDQAKVIDLNLADRRRFKFPLLLGRAGILDFDAVVDPSIGSDIAPICVPPLAASEDTPPS
ncbi:MAG: RimK/LysX family protein [Deltaproteobacteria bacterium]